MGVAELKEALNFVCTIEFWRMAIFWTFSLILSYLQLYARKIFSHKYKPYTRCSPSTMASTSSTRPICIITGATSGLGAAAAHALSKEGFHVVLVGRSSHLLSKAISDIKKQNKNAHLKAFQVDLSSFQSILKFPRSLEEWLSDSHLHASVQLLINNAGILATSYKSTTEGYDQMMGTNYIGAFCLTKVLLPLLQNSPVPSRIVNVTSFTHRNVSRMQLDKETLSGRCFSKSKIYPCARIYEYSKFCLLLLSYELHRQFALCKTSHQTSVIAVDPGAVKTNIMREIPSYLSQMAFWAMKLLCLLQPPEKGIRCILDAALVPPETSGVYFFGGNGWTLDSSLLSYNTKLSKELWVTSCDIFQDLKQTCIDTSSCMLDE